MVLHALVRRGRLPAITAAVLACAVPAWAQSAAPPPEQLDVQQLFATTCGWCHSSAGRVAGKGPQLMDSPRSDDFLRNRIKVGKPGAMPAFGETFSDAQIDAIIAYIRALKPD
ncbi:cytochrome c [Bradyrhizobium sp. ORS 375]|uniref:c-type cytochrome n=1 Tax=Bradyrhizobium sp. (strain ORS 375) TaxID=566679 RepID=UPI0011126BEC|nr:cytochrome c [Bradyrhizobium sp. ORS 375]